MSSKNFLPQVPYGTKDILPVEARRKRELENSLARLFDHWGYEEVITPTFEYIDTLVAGGTDSASSDTFKFFDRNGRTLALRTDMTTPIARVAAMRLKEEPLPLRLFYLANVFRQELAQTGRQCEFYQAGVEFFGAASPAADAEVVALAIESILKTGLTHFQVSLGQVDFISGIMTEGGLNADQRHKVKKALTERDLVSLEAVLDGTGIHIPLLQGKMELLDETRMRIASKVSRAALDNLAEIYELLVGYGVEKFVSFDLGMIRDFEYYTGMVFEAYTPGLGSPLCGGGRYDKLTAAFGVDHPATGFALGIERVLLAIERQKIVVQINPERIYIGWDAGKLPQAIQKAQNIRMAGGSVELAPEAGSGKKTKEESLRRSCQESIHFGS